MLSANSTTRRVLEADFRIQNPADDWYAAMRQWLDSWKSRDRQSERKDG